MSIEHSNQYASWLEGQTLVSAADARLDLGFSGTDRLGSALRSRKEDGRFTDALDTAAGLTAGCTVPVMTSSSRCTMVLHCKAQPQ